MKKKMIVAGFVAVSLFAVLILNSPIYHPVEMSSANMETVRIDRATIYRQFIDETIADCETKGKMESLKGKNINRYAYLMHLKGDFFRARKDALIREMDHLAVGTRSHQMYRFLNGKFHKEVLRGASDS